MNSYLTGNTVNLSVTFEAVIGCAPADPTTVTLQTQDPLGNIVEYTVTSSPPITNPSVGVYQCVIVPALTGVWAYRWEGSGAVVAASESAFEIRPTKFTS